MAKYVSVAQAAEMFVGHYRGNPQTYKTRERIVRAIILGELGKVSRYRNGWLLSESNIEKLVIYMKRRWNMEPEQKRPNDMLTEAV
jgi:hypothetical protein